MNREEVEAALAEKGFRTYVTGEMSYREQVRLFAGAEFVVGAHGAGVINNLYSDGSNVVELYGAHYLPANYEIAQGIGLRYGCLECEPVGDDLRVDVEALVDAIYEMEDC